MLRPVTALQIWVLRLAPPLFAFVLHVSTCVWRLDSSASDSLRLLAISNGPASVTTIRTLSNGRQVMGSPRPTRTGLFARQSWFLSLGIGVMLPLALLTGQAYVLSGWRHESRLAAGCCPRCGHDRGPSPSPGCLECGWTIPRCGPTIPGSGPGGVSRVA